MKMYDVVIVGAGLAGLQCAKLLSQCGAKILLADRKKDLTKGIHTTGIFVRKTLEDFDFPLDCLGKAVRHVTLYSPKLRPINLTSERDEFRVGKMGKLYESFLLECLANGVEFANETRYVGAETDRAKTLVRFESGGKSWTAQTKVLIGADGANSRVAKDLNLDENREWIVGFEEVWRGVPLEGEPRLHCFLDAKLAPGYLAWATNDGEEMHIGVGGYAARFNPREALEIFREKISKNVLALAGGECVEKRGGRIPVGGVLRRIANQNGLLIGDAAGAVSPLTAGGLDPCLRLSAMAANIVQGRLKTDDPQLLNAFSGELFRTRFVSRLWMRRILAGVENQTLLEIGCGALRLPVLRDFASHIFFGRGSFPDVEELKIKSGEMPLKQESYLRF
jgi:flavin-dependent dehydrogenase